MQPFVNNKLHFVYPFWFKSPVPAQLYAFLHESNHWKHQMLKGQAERQGIVNKIITNTHSRYLLQSLTKLPNCVTQTNT